MSQNIWNELFEKSSFFGLHKAHEGDLVLKNYPPQIAYDESVEGFHPIRRDEFLLGRLCASKAHELCTGKELNLLLANPDRSPAWPSDVIGSISHNKDWVGAAVAHSSELLGVGIDFEIVGRANHEMFRYIRSEGDMEKHPGLSEEELLTIIFSCKEALYKSLYPSTQVFFTFGDAALRELDFKKGLFKIELLSELSPQLGPRARHLFEGRIKTYEDTFLSVLEIPLLEE